MFSTDVTCQVVGELLNNDRSRQYEMKSDMKEIVKESETAMKSYVDNTVARSSRRDMGKEAKRRWRG